MELSRKAAYTKKSIDVLILIIMEDTHGVKVELQAGDTITVLILIIMEDTHGGPRMAKHVC